MEYRRLDAARNEIRLLELHPQTRCDNEGIIRCSLEHVALDDLPTYTALSYMWGEEDDKQPLLVGDTQLKVSRNLANAFRSLRRLGYQRVWADAICINQQDLQERSQQVLRMDSIYQSAQSVVAWLADDCLKAMTQFFEKPYWSRVWIIQELAYGKDVDIIWGSERIAFSYLDRTMELVRKHLNYGVTIGIHRVGNIIATRSRLWNSEAIGLLDVLQRSFRSKSTDSLDRVYGLYGLVRVSILERSVLLSVLRLQTFDAKLQIPVPTYSAPLDISFNLTKSVFRMSSRLDIVPMLGNAASGSACPGEPTWSPDWFSPDLWMDGRRRKHFQADAKRIERGRYHARFWMSPDAYWPRWSASGKNRADYAIDGVVLRARGRMIGIIRNVSSTATEQSRPPELSMPMLYTSPNSSQDHDHFYYFEALYFLLTFRELPLPLIQACQDPLDEYLDLFAPSEFINMWAHPSASKIISQRNPALSKWMSANSNFNISGQALSARTRRGIP